MEDSLLGAAARQTLVQPTVLEMVTGSGPVVQAVLYLLVLFSVISWAIVFFKFRQLRRTRTRVRAVYRGVLGDKKSVPPSIPPAWR